MLNKIKYLCGMTLMGMAVLTTPVSAQSMTQIQSPETVMKDLDVNKVIPILTEMGMNWRGATTPSGNKIVIATTDNGLVFVLEPTACTGGASTKCQGISMVAVFSDAADRDLINQFNSQYPFTSVGIDQSGHAYISRYDIADYGIARGNMAVGIDLFVTQAGLFGNMLSQSTVTSAAADSSWHAGQFSDHVNAAGTGAMVQTTLLVKHIVRADGGANVKLIN